MCNNQCWKFDIVKTMRTGYKNHKYCKKCDGFFAKTTVGKYCPCCSKPLRYKPRKTSHKTNLVYL